MAEVEFVLDFGNSWGKWYSPGLNLRGNFRHAIARLSEGDWRNYAGRVGTPPNGYIRVNDTPYAIGDAARRHTIQERPRGASRYDESYYGVGLAYALACAFQRSTRPITLYASHAPIDIAYADDLKMAARGVWQVEAFGERMVFDVRHVHTFDEPIGGFNHFVLTWDGTVMKRNPIKDEIVLICDIGGHTVDVGAIDPGGNIDIASFKSTRTGVLQVIESFVEEVRANNRLMFKNTGDLDPRKVDEAIRTGFYKGGRHKLDCTNESLAATQTLINDVIQIIDSMGGVMNYDHILLTGGGSALLFDRLQTELPQIEFLLVEQNLEEIQYANVYGGAKLFKLLKRLGALA